MILHTLISRLDGNLLFASAEDADPSGSLSGVKSQAKAVLRKLDKNSIAQASIKSDASGGGAGYFIHYLISDEVVYLCICDHSFSRKIAFTYLDDLAGEFDKMHPAAQRNAPGLRPYAFMDFESFVTPTAQMYNEARTTNLDRVNNELRDVTQVLIKNVDDLLVRGESLERMGELSSRLRDDSKKYRRAAVRINWELLVKQYGPFAGLAFFILFFLWWRFF